MVAPSLPEHREADRGGIGTKTDHTVYQSRIGHAGTLDLPLQNRGGVRDRVMRYRKGTTAPAICWIDNKASCSAEVVGHASAARPVQNAGGIDVVFVSRVVRYREVR